MADKRLIDLVSDTSTRPSAGMRRAIAEAVVGDEQSGEDPTTNALQERVADLLGKEAALLVPSGTMCNQIAMLVHCRPGDEVIAADVTHIFTSEAGGGSALAGVQTWPLPSEHGIFKPADLAEAIRDPAKRNNPRSRLVVIEQTVNRGGGAVWPQAAIEDVAKVARKHDLVIHMDGARLLNAAVASNRPAAEITAPVDSVWLDLSKGLGCPIGGVLAGSKAFIAEAWRWKQRLGGAMRQSGIIAAAGLYALDHNVGRLAEDHANARLLAERIGALPGVRIDPPRVETNIVYFDVSSSGTTNQELCAKLRSHGVRMGTSYGGRIRAVTHLDVSRTDCEQAAEVFAKALAEATQSRSGAH
ncbi:MAG: low specificity L-threonine aldolase [Hyphomicrobiaceae bacterium]